MTTDLAKQRERRRQNGNIDTRRYEKTKKGFLVRLYRNMQSRVTGVQKAKWYLYAGVELLSREQFYAWALPHAEFNTLFDAWKAAGYPRKLTPSVDRKESLYGYTLDNMEWVTHSENSRRGSNSRHYGSWLA